MISAATIATSCCSTERVGALVVIDVATVLFVLYGTMWGSKVARMFRPLAAATTITLTTTRNAETSDCEDAKKASHNTLLRKKTTLRQAVSEIRRFSTKQELSQLRQDKTEMLQRWERDEDGWRDLPARAWPAYQPNPEQLAGLRAEVTLHNCTSNNNNNTTDLCKEILFNVATALVFYNLDAEAGFRQYEQLAKDGHVDSMVACGVVLMEGMGVPPQEEKAIEWLKKAVALDSSQGCYELGTVLYTGLEGVLEEDAKAAFELFQRAAKQDHTAALYMMADCLVEGEGTEISVAQAVPLFYRAAERGHRYARQRIRELLAKQEYRS
jgi:TPR repeat protein